MNELLPCPFCGCEPMLYEIEPHKHHLINFPDHHGCWVVECPKCDPLHLIEEKQKDVIAAWNRRAVPKGYAIVKRKYAEAWLKKSKSFLKLCGLNKRDFDQQPYASVVEEVRDLEATLNTSIITAATGERDG